MRNVVLFAALAACGGSNKPAPESPMPVSASLLDCDKVAEHVATTLATDRPNAAVTPAAVEDMVSTRCRVDAWSDETKQCLHAIKTLREGRACATGMTTDQREAIRAQARSLRTANAPTPTEDDRSGDWIRHVVGEPDTVPH